MITASRLFKPAAIVTLSGQKVVNINGDGLRLAFEVRRTLTSSPDIAKASIYNLSQIRRAAMQSAFDETGLSILEVSAGYDRVPIRIFRGNVRRLLASTRNGPDMITIAEADDGGDALSDVTLAGTTGALSSTGMNADTMITVALAALANATPVPQLITRHASVGVALASVLPVATVSLFTTVSVGSVRELIDQAARVLGVRWWLRDGELFMARRNQPTDALAVDLPRSHWLSELNQDGSGLARLSAFMDPNVVPGRLILLEKKPYRCEATTQRGDMRGGPWSVAMVLRRTELLPT